MLNVQTDPIEYIRSLLDPRYRDGLTDEEVIETFQRARGINPDGKLGQVTMREAERPRMCAVPDRIAMSAKDKCRWDHSALGKGVNMELRYHVVGSLPSLSKAQTDDAFAEALSYWTAVCAIVFTPVDEPTKANLLCKVGKIDGPSSTLAWCELPCGKDSTSTQLNSLFDSGEPWVISADPPSARIDAVRVICHEMGHGIGLDHGPDGNLLAPYYDKTIRKPQSWDIAEAQLRYGKPVPIVGHPSTPVPPLNPNLQATCTVRFTDGSTYYGELQNSKS